MSDAPSNAAPDLLIAGADAIGERAEQRDCPDGERSMRRTVAAFNAMFSARLTEEQGWQFMALLKMARSAAGRRHRDDYIDQGAYSALAGECALGGQLHPDVAATMSRHESETGCRAPYTRRRQWSPPPPQGDGDTQE